MDGLGQQALARPRLTLGRERRDPPRRAKVRQEPLQIRENRLDRPATAEDPPMDRRLTSADHLHHAQVTEITILSLARGLLCPGRLVVR
jgi:hypothetical protein